jgi:MFS family permease
MAALDIAIIGPALPAIQHAFNIDGRDLPWLFNIYVLFNLVSTPLMGKLSDIYGRRIIYITAVALFALGSILIMSSVNFNMLLVGRAVQGFGAGGIFPVAASVIGDTIPKEKQGAALGWIGAVFGLAFIIGPPVGGALLLIGWQWIFAVNLPFALVVGFFSYRILPSDKKRKDFSFDYTGMAMLIIALSSLAYGINQIDSSHFISSFGESRVWIPLIVALILFPTFYFHQKYNDHPSLDIKLLNSRQLLITYCIAFGAGIGELSSIYLPSLAHQSFGVSNATASFMLIPMVITLFIFAPLAGMLIDKTEVKYVILAGILLMALGLAVIPVFTITRVTFYISGGLLGAGLSFLLGAPLRYIMNQETTSENRASGQSVLTLFTSMGQIISAALMGAWIQSLGGNVPAYQSAFELLAFLCIPLVIASIFLNRYKLQIQKIK